MKLGGNDSEYLKNYYNLKERLEIHEYLKWAEQNPNFRFEGLIKEAPIQGKLPFLNEEGYSYLMKFKQFMENSEHKLLTDDRPTIGLKKLKMN